MTLDLPWPPSINKYYGRTRFGQTYIKSEGKQFRADVAAEIFGAGWIKTQSMKGPLRVSIGLFEPDTRRRDIDNVLKALLDAMQACGIFIDDSQIRDLHVRFIEQEEGGRVLVDLDQF